MTKAIKAERWSCPEDMMDCDKCGKRNLGSYYWVYYDNDDMDIRCEDCKKQEMGE